MNTDSFLNVHHVLLIFPHDFINNRIGPFSYSLQKAVLLSNLFKFRLGLNKSSSPVILPANLPAAKFVEVVVFIAAILLPLLEGRYRVRNRSVLHALENTSVVGLLLK